MSKQLLHVIANPPSRPLSKKLDLVWKLMPRQSRWKEKVSGMVAKEHPIQGLVAVRRADLKTNILSLTVTPVNPLNPFDRSPPYRGVSPIQSFRARTWRSRLCRGPGGFQSKLSVRGFEV